MFDREFNLVTLLLYFGLKYFNGQEFEKSTAKVMKNLHVGSFIKGCLSSEWSKHILVKYKSS